jgi:hypothetical protein
MPLLPLVPRRESDRPCGRAGLILDSAEPIARMVGSRRCLGTIDAEGGLCATFRGTLEEGDELVRFLLFRGVVVLGKGFVIGVNGGGDFFIGDIFVSFTSVESLELQ